MKTKKPITIVFDGQVISIAPERSDMWIFIPDADYRLDIPASGYEVNYSEGSKVIRVFRVEEGEWTPGEPCHTQAIN